MKEHCGILDAHSYEIGDNGGCTHAADFHCATCGVAVCRWHTWSEHGRFICAVCYGIQGYEVDPASLPLILSVE